MAMIERGRVDWAAIDPLPIFTLFPSAFFPVVLVLLLALLAMILWITWQRRIPSRTTSNSEQPADPAIAETTTVVARSLMTKEEAHLFNLIQLVARETHLVFGKLPLLSLIHVADDDDLTRRTILRTIRPLRADVVLVHPGTLRPAKVIFFSPSAVRVPHEADGHRLVEAVLKAAGIERVFLDLHTPWTAPTLAETLGLQEEE